MRLTDKELSEFADYIPPSKYDMEGTVSALADECSRLRALVKELADALEYWLCDYDCETNGKCRCPADMKREECKSFNMRPLVARARKEVEDGE